MKDLEASPRGAADVLDVIVVGGGFGGMCATYTFREMGLNIQCFEAGSDLGGVWFWNRYPGARVDLPSIDYSFSFAPEIEQEWTWSEEFAAQPELLKYIDFVATRLDLRKHFRFNTRITGARWDEASGLWHVSTDKGDTLRTRYCVMATGPLSVQKTPDIAGYGRFKGESYLSGSWPHEPVSYAGKRVGIIGVGSTGIQCVQEVGRQAGELFVFQRTPSFTMPMRNQKLSADYVADVKRNYAGLRAAARASTVGGLRPQSSRAFYSVTPQTRRQLLEDAWKLGGLCILGTFSDLMTNQEANDYVADFLREKISDVVKDPVTAEKLKPRGYPVFARRACLDTGYYETYNLPNVHLMDCLEDPILEITEKGIRLESGEVELDMIIFATGYDGLTGALMAFDVQGRDGLRLKDKWQEGPRSFLGVAVAGFPNFFMTVGPNGPSALANIIRINENDVALIARAIRHMDENGLTAMEPRQEAEDAWMEAIRAAAGRTLLSKAKTWYVGANVQGKSQGLTMFTGGFAKYAEACEDAAKDGFHAFRFEPARALAAE
ncbi:flavin-containing monooxygenase [Falsigemmobacter intermedius]|uniref:NAD(P)/FAD-dependent oxidoreductase n=1 Tax=Falsigemmobacter intermedius TaxID=1553448 RepID=A0A444MC37_9RHOB|nr:NAD(P)/FAD-dependent oxidoreductase [Falsigemmobacter intermedius]RWY41575.1 NAD(P)/FAD-dependent oxidoreductase [Falsigemmobacter intermedius]